MKQPTVGVCSVALLVTGLLSACGTTAPAKKASPAPVCVAADVGRSGPGHFRFNTSACEDGTTDVKIVTLPLHQGVSHGQTVWFVIMDTSDQARSDSLGVNFAPKLANGKGSKGVQTVTVNNGVVDFPGTVDFSHKHVITPGPNGFPPAKAEPSAIGDAMYSPLIQLPDGTVENAPQVANNTGKSDKVVSLDTKGLKVQYLGTNGFYENKMIHYASFEASSSLAAAIEDVTFAPNLDALPAPGHEEEATSAREELIAFVDGPVGDKNPFAQGLNFALLSNVANQAPRNLLHETPVLPAHADVGSTEYAPMWDVHLAEWTSDAVAAGDRVQMRDVDTVVDTRVKVDPPQVTGPAGAAFGPSGFVVNCPLISIDIP